MNETRKRWEPAFEPDGVTRNWNISHLRIQQSWESANQSLQCWGLMEFGQEQWPVREDFRVVNVGDYHACAITNAGALYCWGDNFVGQASVPSGVTKWKQVAGGRGHTCAIDNSNRMHCWGDGSSGQTKVPCADFWISVSAGAFHTCGIAADHSLHCWGENDNGHTNVPKNADGTAILNWIAVATGEQHTCATLSDKSVQCWGRNTHGQPNVPDGFKVFDCLGDYTFSTEQALTLEHPRPW